MVQRYQQPELPSPLVGTPGVDQSAGRAAEKVADASNDMVQKQLAFATQQFNNAASDFRVAGNAAANAINHQAAIQKERQQLALQLAEGQKKPEIESDLNKLLEQSGNEIAAQSEKDPTAPDQLQGNFDTKVKQYIGNLADSKGWSPDLLARLTPYAQQQALQRSQSLAKQAPKMVLDNLQAGINAAPVAAQKVIDGMNVNDNVTNQLVTVAGAISNLDTVITPLVKPSALVPLKDQQEFRQKVVETTLKSKQELSESGIGKMLLGVDVQGNKTPAEVAQGLVRLDAIKAMVIDPAKSGLTLNADQQEKLINRINQRRNGYEETAVKKLQMEHDTALIDNQINLLMPLEKAEDSPNARFQLQAQIDDKVGDLQKQLTQAQSMPESVIKGQTLKNIKGEMAQLLGGASTMRHEADAYIGHLFQDKKVQLDEIRNNLQRIGIQMDMDSQEGKRIQQYEAATLGARESELVDRATEIAGMDPGPKRQEAAQKLASDARIYAGAAVTANVMTHGEAEAFQKKYGQDILQAAHYTDRGPIGAFFGKQYDTKTPRTAKQKQDDLKQAAAEEAALFKKIHTDGTLQRDVRSQIGHAANLDLSQQLALDAHIRRNFLFQLDAVRKDRQNQGKPPRTPAEEQTWAQGWFNAKVQHALKNDLPEQMLLKKLDLNAQQGKTIRSMIRPPAPLPGAQPGGKDQSLAGADLKYPSQKAFASLPKVGTSAVPEGYNGNIDITKRNIVEFPQGLDENNSTDAARKQFGNTAFPPGSIGSEFSVRIQEGKTWYSIPTIFDGKVHSEDEAKAHFKKTGKYLGKWPEGTAAKVMDDYENRVHNRQLSINGQALPQ